MRSSLHNEATPAQVHEIAVLKDEFRSIKETLVQLVQNNHQTGNSPDIDQYENPNNNPYNSHNMRESMNCNRNTRDSEIYQNERESLIEAKTQLQNRLKLVEQLDKQYTNKLEYAYKNEYQHEIESALDEKTIDQYDKMSKLINDLQTDNYRLKKEFELYKDTRGQKDTLESTKNQLVDMKISKLIEEFIGKYQENPAFHDVMIDAEMVQTT